MFLSRMIPPWLCSEPLWLPYLYDFVDILISTILNEIELLSIHHLVSVWQQISFCSCLVLSFRYYDATSASRYYPYYLGAGGCLPRRPASSFLDLSRLAAALAMLNSSFCGPAPASFPSWNFLAFLSLKTAPSPHLTSSSFRVPSTSHAHGCVELLCFFSNPYITSSFNALCPSYHPSPAKDLAGMRYENWDVLLFPEDS